MRRSPSHHSAPSCVPQAGVRAAAEQHPLPLPADVRRQQLVGDRDGADRLAGEDLELGGLVGVERAVAVEVVLGEVEQDAGVGSEAQRVLELERRRLQDHDRRLGQAGADQRGQRRPDVPDHDRGEIRGAMEVADQLDGRRLPVRSGHRDRLVGHQPPAELELPEHADPGLAGGDDHRRLLRHTRALDQRLDAGEQLDARRAGVHGDPGRLELPAARLGHLARVDPDHLRPERPQRMPHRDPGAGQAHDEVRPRGQRRAREHAGDCVGRSGGIPGGTRPEGNRPERDRPDAGTGSCRAVLRRPPARPRSAPGGGGRPCRPGRPRTRGPPPRGGGGRRPGRRARCRRSCRRS